ncbi:MAG: hypothetical protein U1E37_03685 [Sphingomonadaceae bacterium]
MRFWSEGLGDRELVIDLDRADLAAVDDRLELSGVVDAPAPWEYNIKMQVDDWAAILETAARPDTGDFIATRASVSQLVQIFGGLVGFVAMLAFQRLKRRIGMTGAPAPVAIGNGADRTLT